MGRCLGTAPSSMSDVVMDSIVQGVMSGSPEAYEGRNLVNTCPNGASEEIIGIYAKSRCQWFGRSINLEPRPQRYGYLKLQGP